MGFVAFFSSLYALVYAVGYFVYFHYLDGTLSYEKFTFLGRWTWIGAYILPPYVLFTYYIRGNTSRMILKGAFFYGLGTLIFLSSLLTPWMITDFFVSTTFLDWLNGPMEPFGRLYILMCLIFATYNILSKFVHTRGLERLKLKYFTIGMFIYASSGIITTGIMPLIVGRTGATDIPCYLSVVWIFSTVYAIFKYHLLHIRVAITRTGIFIGIYALLLGVPFYVGYQTQQWTLSAVLLAICASLGPAIYRNLQRKTEDILFRKNREYQQILLASSENILTHRTKPEVAAYVTRLVYQHVQPSFIAVYLRDNERFALCSKEPEKADLPDQLTEASDLISRVRYQNGILFDYSFNAGLFTALTLPIGRVHDMSGLILFGKKPKNDLYSHDDVETFRTLLNQVFLALENIDHMTQAIEEQKKNERLTKEMELAHQIQQSLLPQIPPPHNQWFRRRRDAYPSHGGRR